MRSLPLFAEQNAGPSLTHGTCGAKKHRGAALAPLGRGFGNDRAPALLVSLVLLGVAVVASRRVQVRRPATFATA